MERLIFYITLITFIFLLFLYPIFIKWLKKRQFGQYIRKEGPDLHNYKQGTPTMGGILFVLAIFFLSMLTYFIQNEDLFLIIGVATLLFGFIGFLDDYLSIKKKDSTGLTAIQKLLMQFLFSIFIVYLISKMNPPFDIENTFHN